ncbi:MAG: isopeptide-forming domain-containing fimbrial protein, partial [Eubacteriaceae bacterium]|nr:isopeptide-forming domain-containing fimbrial protein [Eubacteriaceae bacterium]
HTITWTIKNVPSGETAKVGFVVKVNDKATEIIENQAIAKVGNDPEQETNIIKNPLKTPVVKTEITPGEGKQVKVGDEVTYKVHFRNYRFTPETVVVTDKLDAGVDFVSADNNGTYDKATHTITWTFKDMEARKEQDVTFKVKVNEKAGSIIRNQAEVKVGNDPAQKTNVIENPLAPGTTKTGVNGNNNLFNIAVIAVIGLAVLGCGVYFINKKQKEDADKENSEKQ